MDVDNPPQIPEGWIYSMIILGLIGSCILFGIIVIAGYNTYNMMKTEQLFSKPLVLLKFTIWSCSFMACIGWGFLRTNIFHHLTQQKCVIIYIFNYLCFMIAKYCIHILLLWRLLVAFQGTVFQINAKFMKILITLITINFIFLTYLWLPICLKHVTIGISTDSELLQICTLYNCHSNMNLTLYDQIWPILFGGEDFFVGFITLIIFIKKMNDLSDLQTHDVETEALIRKLSILGSTSICSTFIFYTFAVPFYPNLTFLLPFDVIINSLCIILLFDYAKKWYIKLCYCMDKFLQKSLRHQTVDEICLFETANSLGLRGNVRLSIDVIIKGNNKKEDVARNHLKLKQSVSANAAEKYKEQVPFPKLTSSHSSIR